MAVIVTNNVDGDPISMGGGDDSDIKIPSVMISKEDGLAMYNLTRDAPAEKLLVQVEILKRQRCRDCMYECFEGTDFG